MLREGYIYALCDPENLAVRYVGQTRHSPERRRDGHVAGSSRATTRLAYWLRTLPVEPYVRTLEERVAYDQLDERERWWIAEMTRQGAHLLNAPGTGAVTHA